MDLKALADKAKQVFQQRGGAQAAKEDAQELRDVARGQGSATDKAKEAAAAIKDPGAPGPPNQQPAGGAGQPQPAGDTDQPADTQGAGSGS